MYSNTYDTLILAREGQGQAYTETLNKGVGFFFKVSRSTLVSISNFSPSVSTVI